MKLFKRRTGSAQNLAFVGLMCAVDAVMATLSTLVPLSALFVIVFLPLVSALTVIVCEDRYILVYLVAAVALSLGVTAYDIAATLFYIIPATIVGTLYGFLLKKGFPSALLIFLCALAEMGLNYAALPLIKLVSGVDFIAFLTTALGLSSNAAFPYFVPSLILLYSLVEVLLSNIISVPLLSDFGIKTNDWQLYSWVYDILSLSFSMIAIGLAFAEISLGYCFLVAAIFFTIYSLLAYFRKLPAWTYLMLGLFLAAGWMAFAFLYQKMPSYSGLLLGGIVTTALTIPSLIVRLSFKAPRALE
ncbi:MAG: hypothetical protein LKG11_05100 [Bacilli bacterium]|jgi:hypothetical protein|nr:hypothetical protein [Bacilli bacterium]